MVTIFVIQLEKRPEVVERIAGAARRRGFEIQSLSLGPTDMPGVLRMTLVVDAAERDSARLETNLRKLPNILRVDNLASKRSLFRDLAIIKIAATPEERMEIMHLAKVFRARVIDISRRSIVIESTGSVEKIDTLVEMLEGYGIADIARTGLVAMTRGLKGEPRETKRAGLTEPQTCA
jgi:acetolactate synthase-1/3 small subunit